MPYKGNTMKRLFALIALVGAFGICNLAVADDKTAPPPERRRASAAAPAAAPAAPAAARCGTGSADAKPADAAPPAPTAPFLVAADKISGGDTAWMLTSTALVLMMTIPVSRCSTPAWCARRTCWRP